MSEEYLTEPQLEEKRAFTTWTPERGDYRVTLGMTVDDTDVWKELLKELPNHQQGDELRPDLLVLKTAPEHLNVTTRNETQKRTDTHKWQNLEIKIPVLFEPAEKTIGCTIAGTFVSLDIGEFTPDIQRLYEWLKEGNKALGLQPSAREKKSLAPRELVESATEFSFHTSQEFNALSLAQCDGKTFAGYMMNEQAGAIIHYRAGSPHQIRMELSEDERAAGLALSYLENLARAQDADAVLATAYILGVLAPPSHLPPRPYAGGWIDFDDVLSKIGWIPRNAKGRRELHAKIWSFVKFGERAQIIGKRTGAKYEDAAGNPIDTTIHGAAWRVMKTETPDQPTLYTALETPVRAEIVVSKELTALISNPKTAQYFQCGEVLGAIPGGKPAGAWARVVGLALLSFWRRKPREYAAGSLKPTRRELLSHYAAKIAPYEEILASDKPGRAIDYWYGALQILADEGFIARTGEAAISVKEMKSGLPRKNWQAGWLDQTINIEIGAKTKPAFEKVLKPLFALKPRDLKKKPRTKKKPKS